MVGNPYGRRLPLSHASDETWPATDRPRFPLQQAEPAARARPASELVRLLERLQGVGIHPELMGYPSLHQARTRAALRAEQAARLAPPAEETMRDAPAQPLAPGRPDDGAWPRQAGAAETAEVPTEMELLAKRLSEIGLPQELMRLRARAWAGLGPAVGPDYAPRLAGGESARMEPTLMRAERAGSAGLGGRPSGLELTGGLPLGHRGTPLSAEPSLGLGSGPGGLEEPYMLLAQRDPRWGPRGDLGEGASRGGLATADAITPAGRAAGQAPARRFPGIEAAKDGLGAIGDFLQNYADMREAKTTGADKYFHCRANCEASTRGPAGAAISRGISNGRELVDRVTGIPGGFRSGSGRESAGQGSSRAALLSGL